MNFHYFILNDQRILLHLNFGQFYAYREKLYCANCPSCMLQLISPMNYVVFSYRLRYSRTSPVDCYHPAHLSHRDSFTG